jgi:hypothetical protein
MSPFNAIEMRKKAREILEILSLIIVPGIVAEEIGHLLLPWLHWEALPYVLFIVVSLVVSIFLYKGGSRRFLPYAPWLVCGFLAAYLFFRPRIHEPSVVQWSRDTLHSATHCKNEECVRALLASYKDTAQTFPADLDAGALLMTESAVKNALNSRCGLDESFLGTGSSLPDFARPTEYQYARISEYLIPNTQDSSDAVWTWKLDPKLPHLHKKLEDILSTPPMGWSERAIKFAPNQTSAEPLQNPLQVLRSNYEANLGLNDPTPVVIRFQQFPQSNYTGRLGRDERRWVFSSHLGELLANHLSLADAATEAGYAFDPQKPNQTFFIWIFIPSKSDEVVPATWHNVLRLCTR